MKLLLALILLLPTPTLARVFNINEVTVGTYFKGSIGTSNTKDDSFEKTSGSQTLFDDEASMNYSGELGVIFPSKNYSVRIGLEMIAPSLSSDIKGKDSSGTELLSVDSSVEGFFPVIHFEYYVAQNALGRVYFSIGGGYGRVTMKNDYTFTTAGDTAYSPLTSFEEKASQNTYLVETSLGYEMPFLHAVTFNIDIGYRYAVARNLKYSSAGTDFSGGHSEGDPVVNSDGTNKSLDLGGIFTGLSFRFYFN